MHKPKKDVALWVTHRTRDRLNKVKADHRLLRGRFVSQDDVVNILLDHYAATAPREMVELSRTLQPA